MSRVGKKPILIPNNVKVSLQGSTINVSGPKGTITWEIPGEIKCSIENNTIVLKRTSELPEVRAKHGLVRAKINNMVNGVVNPFVKMLDIVGVGFKADLNGRNLVLNLGFSHPVDFPLPDGIDAKVEKQTRIILSGATKEQVGQVAALLRQLKPPDNYKGKGIRYVNEKITLKPGKAVSGTGGGAGGGAKA
jgi:large subunit ribosomal protein L6